MNIKKMKLTYDDGLCDVVYSWDERNPSYDELIDWLTKAKKLPTHVGV